MRFYPALKTREESLDWVERSRQSCRDNGFGLWTLLRATGEFAGDCGLTLQELESQEVEVG